MATQQVIVLENFSNETETTYTGLFWFPITSGIRPQTNGSAWTASGSSAGATTAENAAIEAGTIIEIGWSYTFPNNFAIADVQAFLQQAWANKNVQINGVGPNLYYGYWWNGTSWSNS
jgi:hypothetical protein